MTTAYLEDLTLANRNALFTFLSDALVTAGWTRTVINSDTGTPGAAHLALREEVFQSAGNAVDVGRFFIGMMVYVDGSNTRTSIMIYAFTAIGEGGFVGVTSQTKAASTTVSVVTDTPHLMTTGDILRINGSSNAALNEGNSGSATAHNTITVTGASAFTYTSNINATENGTGGTCFTVFNLSSAITTTINDAFRMNVNDAAVDFVGSVDELGICGDVIQGGFYMFVYIGQTGRGHVLATLSQTFSATGSITGAGAVQTVAVDQTPDDVLVGQPIDIIDVESGRIFRTTIDTIGPGDALQMDIDVGQDFAAGAIIGWDPMPVVCCAKQGTAQTSTPLDTLVWQVGYSINGTRSWAQTDVNDAEAVYGKIEPRLTSSERAVQDTGDVNLGALGTYDVVITKDSGLGGTFGTRGPLRNMIGVIKANEVDFDYQKTGKTSPDDDYKGFTSQQVTGALDHVAFGPNAPGAPPI